MSKLEELEKLRKQFNLIVNGLNNYPKGEINVLVSNHNCLMDIFYLPMAIPEELVSLISARLVYKNEDDRKYIVNKYLNAFPIEAHGGRKYTKMCLEHASEILQSGRSVNIFPEGAYVLENNIYKGHTGASRIIYDARKNISQINLVPVSISISKKEDLENYKNLGGGVIEITILPSIDYKEAYYNYNYAKNYEEANEFLHIPIDIAMKNIANNLKMAYVDNYIELKPKGNVMFADGSVVDVNLAQQNEFAQKYNCELMKRTRDYLSKIFCILNKLCYIIPIRRNLYEICYKI